MVHQAAPFQVIKIDGAEVSYRRLGSGRRRILFFHGFPGSSAQIEVFRPLLESHDLEVLCIDRPGYNRSSPRAGERRDITNRVSRKVLQEFGWGSCELLSVSGGTPYLMNFAGQFPGFADRITIVSGLSPLAAPRFRDLMPWSSRCALFLFPRIPAAALALLLGTRGTAGASSAPDLRVVRRFLPASKADEEAMQDPKTRDILIQVLQEAFHQKGAGPQADARVYFHNKDVGLKLMLAKFEIWHGQEDGILPAKMAERMAESLPEAKLRIVPGEGHYSLILRRLGEILASTGA